MKIFDIIELPELVDREYWLTKRVRLQLADCANCGNQSSNSLGVVV
jgi:hypothetical protein